jgi:alpha-galactosidase
LTVKGSRGTATRELRIVAGKKKLARTPPLGWNSWNCWAQAVDDAKIRQSADWLVKSGLAAHGFCYVNIDDCWEGDRDEAGRIRTNEKFPDMKGLAEYIHAKGLKLGIYSSPGPKTCAGFEGSQGHEAEDALTYSEWGCDYLKYDWCSYGPVAEKRSVPYAKKPYDVMKRALDEVDRDIVYSLCQYGMADVWKWGARAGGHLWRTTGDITDTWGSMAGIGFTQNGLERFAGPGRWNDPDMLVVGQVGWGPKLHATRLSKNEQITHMTLWAILAAPLLIGCNLAALDTFTLDLLTNDDVLDVNQDPLGKQGRRIAKSGATEIWARELEDGTRAVGLFNRGGQRADMAVPFRSLGLRGAQPVRDLWLRKDVGVHQRAYRVTVPVHGAVLVRVGKPKP